MTIPTMQIINLTPELAAKYIAEQAPNRRMKEPKIQRFARDMAAGRWLFTAEALKFDSEDRMIDGQNRCAAVIRSGVTIQVAVASGLAAAAQSVMDTGTPRSTADVLTFTGKANVKDLAASISIHRAWTMGAFGHCMVNLSYQSNATHLETLDYLSANPRLEWAAADGKRIYAGGLRLPVGSIATAIMETSRINEDDSADFFSRIRELRTAGTGDPVAALIKRVSAIRDAGQRTLSSTSLFLLFRTWNAFRDGEKLTRFQLGAPSREGSPATWAKIPEPK